MVEQGAHSPAKAEVVEGMKVAAEEHDVGAGVKEGSFLHIL